MLVSHDLGSHYVNTVLHHRQLELAVVLSLQSNMGRFATHSRKSVEKL